MLKDKRIAILVLSLFIPMGFLAGFLLDNYNMHRMKKQQQELLHKINDYSRNLELTGKKLDSIRNSEYMFEDTIFLKVADSMEQ
jgi:hypothetical protein